MKKKKRKEVMAWILYDFGNSAFITTIIAAVLPIYYHDVAASNIDGTLATSYWGYSQSIAVLIVAVLSPILGAISDYSKAKKKFLRFFAYMGIISSILLAFVGEGDYIFASILVILGVVGFSGGNVFYDAFLPELAKEEDIDKISTRGYAWGYIGGGILLAINLLMILKYEWFGIESKTLATQLSFVSVGIWWFFFLFLCFVM